MKKTINYFKSKPGTEININGVSKLVRSDGSFTTVPAAYWAEKDKVDAHVLFKKYTEQHQTVVIRATENEVISNKGMSSAFLGIEIRDVKTNHNFEGEGRVELLKEVRQILED